MMRTRRWGFPALLLVAGFALWLLLAGPPDLLGVDTGQAGTALLVTVAWVALFAIHRMPRVEFERAASPGGWTAWSGVVFMAVAIAYFLSKLHVIQGASIRTTRKPPLSAATSCCWSRGRCCRE